MDTETRFRDDERASRWEPQRRMTLDAARRRSSFVKILRWGFILMAVLIVGIVIAYIIVRAQKPEPVQPPTPAPTTQAQTTDNQKPDDLVIETPTFQGVDKNGRPYTVKADRAIRRTNPDGTSSEVTDLVNPILYGDPDDKGSSKVTADKGVFDAQNNTLELIDNVKLVTPSGYVYTTSHALAYNDDDRIEGNDLVIGKGPDGTIEANGFEVLNGGKTVHFKGQVKTHIYNQKPASGGTK